MFRAQLWTPSRHPATQALQLQMSHTGRPPTAPAPKTEDFNALPLDCHSLQRVQGQRNVLEELNLQQRRCAAANRIFLGSQTTVGTGNVRNVRNGGTYQTNSSHIALTFRVTNICAFKTIITHRISRRLSKVRVSHACNETINEPTVTRYATVVNTNLRCL